MAMGEKMSGFTKEIIIKTLFELLNEKPLAKITVKDIVERCGVNRNTFYYHFRDISDVVEYALLRDVDKVFSRPVEVDSFLDCLEVLERIKRPCCIFTAPFKEKPLPVPWTKCASIL